MPVICNICNRHIVIQVLPAYSNICYACWYSLPYCLCHKKLLPGTTCNVCHLNFMYATYGKPVGSQGSTMPPPRTTRWPSNKPKTARLIYEPAIQGYSLNFTYDSGLVDFLKKAIPSHKRTYDSDTKTWNFSSEFFDVVRLLFDAHRDYTLTIVSEAEVLRKIQEQEEASRHNWQPQAHSINDELQKFEQLLLPVEVGTNGDFTKQVKNWDRNQATKVYRKAAMFYHPDRNGGDATKMSELNAVWQVLKESYYIK